MKKLTIAVFVIFSLVNISFAEAINDRYYYDELETPQYVGPPKSESSTVLSKRQSIVVDYDNSEATALALLIEVMDVFVENFNGNITKREFIEKVLGGGISSINKYSRYLNPKKAKMNDVDTRGHFYGIGARIGQKKLNNKTYIVIMSVLKNTPAEKGGLKSGDYIIMISSDGIKEGAVSTYKMSVFDTAEFIRGEKHTKVYLNISRNGETLDFYIVRDDIKIEYLESRLLDIKSLKTGSLRTNIGYVRINEFMGDDLKNDFDKILSKMKKDKVKGIVLDLRNNPGGLLKWGVEIANMFRKDKTHIFRNTPIVSTRGKNNNRKFSGPLIGAAKFNNFKVVVLVNNGSASASEIVTAYLKNYCGAKVVGKKTFGKGVGQSVIRLRYGGTLIVTSFEYLVGVDKIAVDEVGVEPDYDVDNPEDFDLPAQAGDEKDDRQLKKAIEVLEEMILKK